MRRMRSVLRLDSSMVRAALGMLSASEAPAPASGAAPGSTATCIITGRSAAIHRCAMTSGEPALCSAKKALRQAPRRYRHRRQRPGTRVPRLLSRVPHLHSGRVAWQRGLAEDTKYRLGGIEAKSMGDGVLGCCIHQALKARERQADKHNVVRTHCILLTLNLDSTCDRAQRSDQSKSN